MYSAIISRKKADGTYYEVGTTNRVVLKRKTLHAIKEWANRYAPEGWRAEVFPGDSIGYEHGRSGAMLYSENPRQKGRRYTSRYRATVTLAVWIDEFDGSKREAAEQVEKEIEGALEWARQRLGEGVISAVQVHEVEVNE